MLTAIGDVLRECYRRGWITTRDGNVSLRMSLDGSISNNFYITPKGVRKNIIHPEHIIKVDIISPLNSSDVSTEFLMHYLLQLDATTTRCVLHVHPTHVVAAMHAGYSLQELAKDFPELKRYTKVGSTVDYCEPGSEELASKTNKLFRLYGGEKTPIIYDIIGQQSHGVCSIGKNPWDAFEHVERLNHICEIALLANKK